MKKLINPVSKLWSNLEKKSKRPLLARKLIVVPYKEFEKKVLFGSYMEQKKIIKSLYSGDVYLLKKAFSKKFSDDLINEAWEINKNQKKSFHQMTENCPNFHRLIDEKITKNYSANHIKHAFYFFPWNKGPVKMYEKIYKRWRLFKFLGGFNANEYENNTPKDGVIDRFQIVHYPAGAGWLETHNDPYHNQRVIISGFLSQRNKDYKTGGFYYYKKNNQILDCDDYIETGDMITSYATVLHGVSQIDSELKVNYDSPRGRWFLGLYSNDSDVIKKRKTTKSMGKKYLNPKLPIINNDIRFA